MPRLGTSWPGIQKAPYTSHRIFGPMDLRGVGQGGTPSVTVTDYFFIFFFIVLLVCGKENIAHTVGIE